jgi:hypothetical protein
MARSDGRGWFGCPFRVIFGSRRPHRRGLLCPHKRTSSVRPVRSEKCHVWTAPSWQELSSRMQDWSVRPCVRPVGAVHMTAGHNALRGLGPGQNPAFDNAMALVGCPDRRIDRLCITCCSPSQPSHHAGCPARSRLRRKRDGLPIMLALGHHGPGHPRNLVSKGNGGDLRRAPRQQRREPGPMPCAVDLGVTYDGECTGHKQAASLQTSASVVPMSALTSKADIGWRSMPPPR